MRADRGLIPQAIEEALRFETPLLNITRLATKDTEIDGVPIPAGSTIMLMLAAANREETRYPIPTGSSSAGTTPNRTSRSATGPICAWACTWPGWRSGWP